MATKKKEAPTEEKEQKSLEELILNRMVGKYSIVSSAAVWAAELRRREEYRHLNQNEILELALSDVLAGKVSPDELEAATEAAEAQARAALAASAPGKDKK